MIGCGVVAGVAIIAVIEHNLSCANPGYYFHNFSLIRVGGDAPFPSQSHFKAGTVGTA